MQNKPEFDGPIAGENYTSDTRNYPWHRPPDLSEYDDVVEHLLETISDPETLPNIMSILSTGVTIAGITDFLILDGVGKGKFAIDMGLLAAGPSARFIQIMADDFGVDADMGLDEEVSTLTPNMIKKIEESMGDNVIPDTLEEEPVETEEDPGFMAAPEGIASDLEQDSMLGYSSDDVEESEEDLNA